MGCLCFNFGQSSCERSLFTFLRLIRKDAEYRCAIAFRTIEIGMLLVILNGGIDLSVGSIVGLSGVVAGYLMQGAPIPFTGHVAYLNIWAVLLVSLIVGIFFGWLNGLLVAKLNIAPFIATLGMLYVARGFAKLITNGETFTKLEGKPNLSNTGFIATFAAKPFGVKYVYSNRRYTESEYTEVPTRAGSGSGWLCRFSG